MDGDAYRRVGKETSKNVAALRYYEQRGLLPAPQRTETGYRDYAPETVERVCFILHAQERGFSLKEITAVLAVQDRNQAPCQSVARIAHRKIERLDKKIAQFQVRRTTLAEALDLWERGELAAAPFCPILDAPQLGERRRNEERARTIEVFTAGCPLCQETLQYVREAVQSCGCNKGNYSPKIRHLADVSRFPQPYNESI